MARRIEVELVGDSRSLERAFGRAGKSGSTLGRTFGKVVTAGAVAAGAAMAGLGVATKIGFDEFTQGQKVAAQTNAVIRSTGKAANVTAKQVSNLAESLMKKSGVDDEVIASGENMLLTFKQIRNEAGKGNDIFNQATKATLDLSVAMGKDMQSSAILVGKALNDPIRGLSALRRVGIQFTEAQEKAIKKMVETGDVAGAQKVILKELESQFGGSATAAGKTFAGQINILRESFNNWAGDMVSKVMPALQDFLGRLTRAKGFKAKLKIVWTGVREAGADLIEKLEDALLGAQTRHAIRGDLGKLIRWQEGSRTGGLVKAIQDGLRSADWTQIGQTVGKGISSRVKITADFLANALTTMNEFIDSHLDEFANTGAKLALAIINKLLDPAFWKENWKLVLGVAIAVFPISRFFSLGGKIAGAILSMVGRLLPAGLRNIGFRAVQAILGVLGRLPGLVQRIILAVVSGSIRILGNLLSFLRGAFKAALDKIPGWVRAAFRLGFVVAFVNAVKDVYNWLRRITGKVWRVVVKVDLPKVGPSGLDLLKGAFGASGGIVTRPTFALIGEAGPEAVIPLNRTPGSRPLGTSAGGGGGTVRVIVVGGDRAGVDWIRQLDQDHRRTNGGRGILG